MHEMSIAQNIVEIVSEALNKNNAAVLREVGVDVGELVAVVPDSLEFCYNVLKENTPLAGSHLKINILPLMGFCQSCKKNVRIEKMNFFCPDCQSTNIQVYQGEELNISYLEVD